MRSVFVFCFLPPFLSVLSSSSALDVSLNQAGRDGAMAVTETLLANVNLVCASYKPAMLPNPPTSCPLAQASPGKVLEESSCALQLLGTSRVLHPQSWQELCRFLLSCRPWSTCTSYPCLLEKLQGHVVPFVMTLESGCISTRLFNKELLSVSPRSTALQASPSLGGS